MDKFVNLMQLFARGRSLSDVERSTSKKLCLMIHGVTKPVLAGEAKPPEQPVEVA